MNSPSPGSYQGQVLSGRYRLQERVQTTPDGEVWRALDATLDRTVSVRLMRPNHPFAADVADAARRAALIDDARLVRVLDVGSDSEAGFVVSEYLDGDSLAALVERSPLPAQAARRIIGEVAEGLDLAAARGLHHLRLTPRSVIVGRDGAVKIAGTAVEAAAAGLEPGHAATASRVDAVALVALLYSGLTGRWPLGDAGYPPAPRGEGGSPVPPADLVPGVPNDLDTLCVVTLGPHDDGPRTPGDLVTQLAPWPSAEDIPLRPVRRSPRDGAPVPLNPALMMRGRTSTAKRAAANQTPADGSQPATPPEQPERLRRSASLFPSPSVAATGSLPIPAEPAREGPRRMDSLFTQQTVYPTTTPPSPGAENPEAAANRDAAANPGSTAQPAASNGRPPAPDGRPNAAPRRPAAAPPAEEPLVPWGAGWLSNPVPPSRLESTGPFPIIIPTESPPQEQSRLVIFSVIVVLVVILGVAIFTLRDFGGSKAGPAITPAFPRVSASPSPGSANSAAPTQAPSASSSPSAGGSPSVSPSVGLPSAPVQIASIQAIDPQGDNSENNPSANRAADNDPSTFWKSDTYSNSEFGGLKKGLGLAVKLKSSAVLHSATIDIIGSGGDVEIRTGNSPDQPSSTVVGKASFITDQVTVPISSANPSSYVILWFTKLPAVDGAYRAEVSEVQLK